MFDAYIKLIEHYRCHLHFDFDKRSLNYTKTYKSPAHSSTGTKLNLKRRKKLLTWIHQLVLNKRFHHSLTPLPGVLFTIPSQYSFSLSVNQKYLALRDGSRRFQRRFTWTTILGMRLLKMFKFSIKGRSPNIFGIVFQLFSLIKTYRDSSSHNALKTNAMKIKKFRLNFFSLAVTKKVESYFFILFSTLKK